MILFLCGVDKLLQEDNKRFLFEKIYTHSLRFKYIFNWTCFIVALKKMLPFNENMEIASTQGDLRTEKLKREITQQKESIRTKWQFSDNTGQKFPKKL